MDAGEYFSQGLTYEQKMLFDEAVSCYREAILLEPNHPFAHARLGFALYNRRHLNEAEASLKHSIHLNPHYDEAYCCLGMICREQGLYEDAITYLQKALEINPESPWLLTNFGVTLQFSGKRKEGQMYLHRAFDKNPNIQNPPIPLKQLLTNIRNHGFAMTLEQEQVPKKILIVVSAFNRKKITAISLRQIQRFMNPGCRLHVYNDHSTEYDSRFLSAYADEVIQLPEKMGIDKLRWFQLREFLKTDCDYLYLTDNDVFHDPDYLNMIDQLYERGRRQMPVSLFHNVFMLQPRLILYYEEGIMIKTSAPGASMFLDRKMVETIVSVSKSIGDTLDYLPWDNRVVACLRLPWITPECSYLEHFGAGGLNSDNYERERAINPTEYLRERRERILRYLRQDDAIGPEL